MNFQQYNDNVGNIRTRDIVSNSNNRIVLRRIKRNSKYDENNESLFIQNQHDEEGEDCIDYVPEGVNDMGWLGYFIGKNKNLKNLYLSAFTPSSSGSFEEVLEPFLLGVNNNRSITSLDFCSIDLLGGRVFTVMGPFFENCLSLSNLLISDCHLGEDGWRLLVLAIGSIGSKILQKLSLGACNISDEGMVDIITSLSMHPNLQTLWLSGNRLSTKGCTAMATLFRCSATELQHLDLGDNEINDEGIDALVPVFNNCSHLQTLVFKNNPAISMRGWRCVATILESPNCSSLINLHTGNNVDDEVVTTLTRALENNRTLLTLGILNYGNPSNPSITDEGWKAISELLCDTSNVNSTFQSNHTLQYLGNSSNPLRPLLQLNERGDKKEVAMIKVLQHHNDFDMTPFFEWEFKVLPLMIDWFEKAATVDMPEDFESNIEPKKLSSIYQFIRGMPLLYVETRLRKELEDIKVTESKMEEKQQKLEGELLELEAEHQLIQEKKTVIMKQLSR